MSTTLKLKKPNTNRVPSTLRILCDDAPVLQLQAAAAAEDGGDDLGAVKLRKFSMTDYTGSAMRLDGWQHPVVVDLAGLRVSRKQRPILKDHDRGSIVGHTNDIRIGEQALQVAGVISGVGQSAQEIIATSENGFPWQASLGASAEKVVFIPEGKTTKANGREFLGPVFVARRSTLGEVSFVALGADDNTEARLEATEPEDDSFDHDSDSSDDDSQSQWQDDLDGEADCLIDASLNVQPLLGNDAMSARSTANRPNRQGAVSPLIQMRAELAAESRRLHAIRQLCAGKHHEIEAQAIEQGWGLSRTELAILRAERPASPKVRSTGPVADPVQVLEVAACLTVQIPEGELAKEYPAPVMAAARSMRLIGLKELAAQCARIEGREIPPVFGDGSVTIRAAFSTLSLPGIMENVMNKTLLAAYESTPIAAYELCSVGSVSDFKEISRYRLLGTGGFEKIAPDGEIKHGKLSEDKYTNKVETYGQMLTMTRNDIFNDDLNAFMDIPRQMGRSGAEVIDHLFFTLLLSNPAAFFSIANNNYLSGVDTAFGVDSLSIAKTTFRKQKAGPGTAPVDQRPINIRPEMLVVPVELETEAEVLMGASQLMMDGVGTKTKIPVDNPHRNKYRVISAPHLSDTFYPGASPKAWYLFANPTVLAAFEIVFLNGRRTPVIERVDLPANKLGIGFRSYLDVGVQKQDPRGAVLVKGEA